MPNFKDAKVKSAVVAIDRPLFLTYPTLPTLRSDIVEKFFAHLRATGQPETFQGLHPGPIDKDQTFLKIAPIEIDARRRPDRARAPCPMCQQNNKFLHGWLIFLPQLQALAAIGGECAGKEVGAEADREYAARRRRDNEEDYLLAQLPLIPARLAHLTALLPIAEEALRVHRLFRSKGRYFQRRLNDVVREGGQLTLGSDAGAASRSLTLGPLAGSTAFKQDYNPVAELKSIIARLRRHDCGRNQDAALDYILRLNEVDKRKAYIELFEANRAYYRFRERLNDFVAFFASDNIARVSAWASHPAQPLPFEVTVMAERGVLLLCLRYAPHHFKAAIGELRTVTDPWPEP